ncbi:MAG: LOW QUALITY PROTEIN: hypothetical protein KVP17_000870 [Porospora cf. gigantea B]|uniref:uncharacterized protein n=1 Tax=Porospora cf. gigantea B TaxID=2853592 RepID=UPI003571D1CC|nr:MAG: LOW QUALITY PROTEIN: hypothetical protein KVP17_000870 [Porospora cf. gigantea B]
MAMRYASQLLSTGQITGNVQTLLAELRSRLQVVSDRTAELVALSENLDVSTDAAASAEVNRFTAMPIPACAQQKSVHANLKTGDLETAIESLHEWGQKRLIPDVNSLPATKKWRDEVDEEMKLAFDCVLDAIVAAPDQQPIGVVLLLETLLRDQDAVARAYLQSLEKATAGMRLKMLVTHDGSLRGLASVSRFTARIAEMVASCENLLPDKRALYGFANRELDWLLWYVGDLFSSADLADPTSIAHVASFIQAEGQTSPELEALGLSISQDLDSILLDFLLKAAVHTMEPTLLKFRL